MADNPKPSRFRVYLSKVINGLLFYVVWFFVAGAVAKDMEWLGLCAVGVFLFFHFLLCNNRKKELVVLGIILLLGLILDTAYILTGTLDFRVDNPVAQWVAPIWILSLYALFSTTLDYSLSWIALTPIWMRALLGAGGGVASYWAGAKMHVVQFLLPNLGSIIVIGIVWALLFPFVYWLNAKLDERFPPPRILT